MNRDIISRGNHTGHATAGLKKLLAAFCVFFFLFASLDRAEAGNAHGIFGLNFAVVAPDRKGDGSNWDGPGDAVRDYLPDIFVCLRATDKRWDCAPHCQNSRTCWGTLKIQGYTSLTIGVFDRDDPRNEAMYKFKEITDPGKCNPCTLQYADGSVTLYKTTEADAWNTTTKAGSWARVRSKIGCPSPLADPTTGNWLDRSKGLVNCKTTRSGICKVADSEQKFVNLEVHGLGKNELDDLSLQCRIGYLERLVAYLLSDPWGEWKSERGAIELLYRSKRGIYKDPNLGGSRNKGIYDAIAEEIRDYLDIRRNNGGDLRTMSMNLNHPPDYEDIVDSVFSKLGRDISKLKVHVCTPSNAMPVCHPSSPSNAEFRQETVPRSVVIWRANFEKRGIIEQIYILVEEAYHAHQYRMTDEYGDGKNASDQAKIYTINFISPANPDVSTIQKIGDLISSYQHLARGYGSDDYYSPTKRIYSAYQNSPIEYNAKLVAGYIVGRAICYRNQTMDPIEVDWKGSTFGVQCR